jgi:calcineurin-like phosphoesterase family protein
MKKFFIVSDVHSYFDIFYAALLEMGFDINNPEHILALCGDLFDRGDQTVELFEFVKSLGDRFIYIRGNHEDLLFDCMDDIRSGRTPRHHHFHNGTVKTICQFCGQNEWIIYDPTWRDKICEIMQPVLDFIDEKSVNYAEIGDYVLVHGWVPCYQGLDDFRNATDDDWKQARWDNGMEMWRYHRCRVDGKTVICGHWHCSWGWSHIKQERKEFPATNRKDWQKSFEPFVEDGIMAIDACTAYSKICNVVVIEN